MRIGTRITRAARRTLLAVGFVIALGSASAQPPDLVTDRPDQTESATVVLRGLVQVEGVSTDRGPEACTIVRFCNLSWCGLLLTIRWPAGLTTVLAM